MTDDTLKEAFDRLRKQMTWLGVATFTIGYGLGFLVCYLTLCKK